MPCPFCAAKLTHKINRGLGLHLVDNTWDHPSGGSCPLANVALGDPLFIYDHPSAIAAWNTRAAIAATKEKS
jgi:hypothetical protein